MSVTKNRFFLIDAMALIYRSYFAMQKNPRITSYGKNTNASFGFTNTLFDIIKNESPTHIAVAFDSYEPTERHIQFNDYKANRQQAPEELIDSLQDIKDIIRGFGIPIYELAGYEADDIIGTIALKVHPEKDFQVYMVTPDKDYGQLVRDNIFMYKPPFMGRGFQKMTSKDICDKWDLQSVDQVVDMLALMGDASDNIAGIAGIGEKTAAKLLGQYTTLENVLDHADEIKGAIGEKIRQGKESALMSQYLARIITEVPVSWSIDECKVHAFDDTQLREVFNRLEFRTLSARILGTTNTPAYQQSLLNLGKDEQIKTIHTTQHDYQLISSAKQLQPILDRIEKADVICIDTETTGLEVHRVDIIGISLCFQEHEAFYIDFRNGMTDSTLFELFKSCVCNKAKTWVGHNIKFDLLMLTKYGVELVGTFFDTMLAKYVLGDAGRKSMDAMSLQYLNYQPISFKSLIGEKAKAKTLVQVDIDKVANYAAEDADITFQLYQYLKPLIEEKNVGEVLYKIENPLISVLSSMEFEGVALDSFFLEKYSQELGDKIDMVKQKIYDFSGEEFNLSSPKQLGNILFDKMQLKMGKTKTKTKTKQYATGEEVLKKLIDVHPIVSCILEFRELFKLKNTYVDALPKLVNQITQRIHTSFNQAVAVTGRLSSQHPNLQNIPIRTEKGKKIRKAFISRSEDYMILSADYSQIELRIIAAISKDRSMCQDFQEDRDIHTSTAAAVYGVHVDEVDSQMRHRAKSVNFGIIYGQGAWGLAENLSIPVKEAKVLIESYFKKYTSVKDYMNNQIQFAKKNGFVKTLMGRRHYLENIHSANATVRGFAERNAINTPIQGTAADMIKMAMIRIQKQMEQEHLQSKMILQVHDELIFDTHKDEVERMYSIVTQGMVNALPLPNEVPVKIEIGTGKNWLEAH